MNKRNMGVDVLRCLCAFLVLCIHTDYYGKLYVEPMTRFAVPIFFMICGYCYTFKKDKKSQIVKLLILTLVANGIYAVWYITKALIDAEPVLELVRSWFSAKRLIRFVLFNRSPVEEHLWYLGAQLYVLIIMAVIDKVWDRKKLYCLIPLLLAVNVVLGNYADWILGREIPRMLTRNFLFMGIPCFLLGDLLREYGQKIKLRSGSLIAILILSCVTVQIERILLSQNSAFVIQDFFVSTIFSAIAVFQLINLYQDALPGSVISTLAFVGKNYSLGIYILHPMVISILTECVEAASQHFSWIVMAYFFVGPAVNLAVSIAIVALFSQVSKKMRGKFQKQQAIRNA